MVERVAESDDAPAAETAPADEPHASASGFPAGARDERIENLAQRFPAADGSDGLREPRARGKIHCSRGVLRSRDGRGGRFERAARLIRGLLTPFFNALPEPCFDALLSTFLEALPLPFCDALSSTLFDTSLPALFFAGLAPLVVRLLSRRRNRTGDFLARRTRDALARVGLDALALGLRRSQLIDDAPDLAVDIISQAVGQRFESLCELFVKRHVLMNAPYLAVRGSLCWVSCNYGGAVRLKSSEQAGQLQRIESFDGCPAAPYNAFRHVSIFFGENAHYKGGD